jgi:tetratricopeptide (TPR) repeat protein
LNFMSSLVFLLFLLQVAPLPGIDAVRSALRTHDYSRALRLTGALLQQDAQDEKLWTLQGLAHSGARDEDAALDDFKHALKISPGYLPARKAEAQVEYKTENPQGIVTLTHILKLQPNDQTSHAMRAALEYKQHNCEAVVQDYSASKSLLSSQPTALNQFGQCLLAVKRAEEAVAVFHQLITLRPNLWEAKYNLAIGELMTKHPEDALATLRPLMASNPRQPKIMDLASTAYESVGDTPRAVSILRQALVDNPRDVGLYLHFTDLCFTHRSFQVGVDVLNAGLEASPHAAQLYLARGILLVQLGKYESGGKDFATAERIDPTQSYTSVAQGLTQLQKNNLDQALATTEAQIKRNPNDPFLYYLKAETLKRKGTQPGSPQLRRAVEAARSAIRLKPDFPLAEDLLGSLYLQENKLNLAFQQFESALKHDPSDQSALYHMIVVSRKSGRTKNIPDLLKRFAEAKALQRKQDALTGKYMLVEPNSGSTQPGPQ